MRRLGLHLMQEVRVIEQQARTAEAKGDKASYDKLKALIESLGLAIAKHEDHPVDEFITH